MIVFLYGPDDYRRAQKKKEIIAEFRKKHSDLGLGFFDSENQNVLDDLASFARNQSIFEDKKLAVFTNAFEIEDKKLAKALLPLAKEKSTTVLISEREKPVKALAFLIQKPPFTQKFENFLGAEWDAFIKREAKNIGLALADDAARFLGAVYQGNSWALVTELQKLAALKIPTESAGANVAVHKNDLDAFGLETTPNYWALLNGLKSYDMRARLSALETLFSINDPAPKIFNIFSAQAGEKLPRMAAYDIAIKSGKLDYEEALLDLAIS